VAKIINGLEKIIGKEKKERLVNNEGYKWLADGVSVNLFSLSFMANEMTLGGMNFYESLSTRVTAFFGNMVVGRPYVAIRKGIMKSLKIKKETTRLARWPAEIAAFAIGQTPAYIGVLAVGNMLPKIIQGLANEDLDTILGAYQDINWAQVRNATTSLTLLSPLVGPSQGWTSEFIRDQTGLETAYEKKSQAESISPQY